MDLLSALPISLRQLQYIVAVAKFGSFRRAAEACHVAQPSLSAQVAVAERMLGVQLFERTARRVRVPPPAAPLVAQARRILVAAGDLQELARHRADPFRGTLRIGVIPTICPYLLPDIARPLARDYPQLTIEWSEERTARLVDQVRRGRSMPRCSRSRPICGAWRTSRSAGIHSSWRPLRDIRWRGGRGG
jgi:LysR family hydrogen peroxide-inducible transcriptional activator